MFKHTKVIVAVFSLVWVSGVYAVFADDIPTTGAPGDPVPSVSATRYLPGCEKLRFKCLDEDGDGIPDFRDPQKANPNVPIARDRPGCEHHTLGCTDEDGDGTLDFQDPEPRNPNVPIARDWSGCEHHTLGCTDEDGDGTSDFQDPEPDNPNVPIARDRSGCEHHTLGCTDEDGDGIPDFRDPQKANPNVPIARDRRGCEKHALGCTDGDEDGIPDYKDTSIEGIPCGVGAGCKGEDIDIANPDPTFIQISPQNRVARTSQHHVSQSETHDLVAKISVPYEDALVRANVPIFGQAHGKNFKEYRVEYGQGHDPSEWTTIAISLTPQVHNSLPEDLYDSPDITILGNLATWDTGLKNYVYLPSHPQNHPINQKGTHTLRLVVVSKDGSTVEDRVHVHVANVIPNAWGGLVKSPDGRVSMTVPEQSLMDSFRLILIQSVINSPLVSNHNRQLLGSVYEVKEPGEQFATKVVLEMDIPKQVSDEKKLDRIGIYGYDPIKGEWLPIPSYRYQGKSKVFCKVDQLHAFYALMHSEISGEGSTVVPTTSSPPSLIRRVRAQPVHGHYLVQNSFEENMGEWSNGQGDLGANVSLDNSSTFDGTHALKITNTNTGGNFAVNVRSTPFDAREFPVIQFDYRIPNHVKTSFYVKVSGRWYEIGFTDDFKDLKNKRVNIAHIGDLGHIEKDDAWHTVRFNLYNMLRTKTGHTVVENMIMADWDVGGYMRLHFGENTQGATYYIDNFSIGRELGVGMQTNESRLIVDNFNQKKTSNAFGGPVSTFHDSLGGSIRTVFHRENATGKGHALALSYDVSQPESFSGYLTTLGNLDLRGYQALTFWVKSSEPGHDLMIGLKDYSGTEKKVPLRSYLPQMISKTWEQVMIPLTAFSPELDRSSVENLSLSFVRGKHSQGIILVDDIEFHKNIKSVRIENFAQASNQNLLGRNHWSFTNGAAAITGSYTKKANNGFYRLSYGGNIGDVKAYASDLFTYAGWTTQIGGIDCSRCGTVSFRIRGAQGDEKPNVYLDDGNFRWGVDLEAYRPITTEWQSITIPLNDFAEHGVDLTHLAEFQMVFEWENMFGTIYLDDIQFGKEGLQPNTSLAMEHLPGFNE